MKTRRFRILITLGLLTAQSAFSQTFLGISTLNSPSQGSLTVDRDSWRASPFRTDSQSSQVSELVASLPGFGGEDVSGFASIYSDHETENRPDSRIAGFLDNPQDLGSSNQFRFMPDGTIELDADTKYWLVFGSNATQLGGEFEYSVWIADSADSSSGRWSAETAHAQSQDQGGTWTTATHNGPHRFSIMAIIPEPSHYAFFGGCLLIAFASFRRMHFEKRG